MQKKLTITIDEAVYYRLYSVIGERKISKFIEQLVKPYVINEKLGAAYKAMAQDTKAEEKANEWVEGLIECDFYEKS
ncbi:MAG: hypothetical protein AB8U78_02725 [Rickettsia slovaca]|uniref:Addiction module antitoxin n=1 Tax=Rickettsia slovaca str. D-CWPP TaxID=1105109 RepID=H8LPU9_RICSL|nr:hypothetical protein [Rickettsia slovaca]AFD20145.1 hypothetical protein MC3_06415 [Rickettsia slovaca str. D-CWPP]